MDWKKHLDYRNIRFWLTILFILRLYGITMPPLEFQHPWRQADGLMIARNFYETEANIFYPRVDTAGELTGITGSEFPILNYLIYLVSLVFGYQHWYGRLIVLIFSTLGSLYFYRSIKKFFSETVAFNATIILTASYWFSYSRKVFPDCFAAGLCLMALYFVIEFLEKGKPKDLALYVFLGSLGCLAKISSSIILSVVVLLIFFKDYSINRKYWTFAFSIVILACIGGWYFVWVPYLNETFGYGDHFTTGYATFGMGWDDIRNNWQAVLPRLFIVPVKYLGFVIFLLSMIYIVYKRQWNTFWIFMLPYACFLVVILKTGIFIIADQYYVLCAIPAMALVSGYGLSQIANKKIMFVILASTAIENIGDQINDSQAHKMNKVFENVEALVDSVSNRNDLFVINSDPYCPTVMYFAHRKGWTVHPSKLLDKSFLEELKGKGCKFVLVCKQMYNENYDVTLDLPQISESEYYRIYSLK